MSVNHNFFICMRYFDNFKAQFWIWNCRIMLCDWFMLSIFFSYFCRTYDHFHLTLLLKLKEFNHNFFSMIEKRIFFLTNLVHYNYVYYTPLQTKFLAPSKWVSLNTPFLFNFEGLMRPIKRVALLILIYIILQKMFLKWI